MHIVADRVKETTITTGTGSITLAGAVVGYKAFSAFMANGQLTQYVIDGGTTGEWEIGLGKWTTGGILVRVKVDKSSNSDNLVNFSSGTKSVFISYLSSRNIRRVKIGFLGGSGGAVQYLNGPTFPEHFRYILEGSGYNNVEIKNLQYNGATANQAMNATVNGTNTAVTQMIAWKPDMVLCSYGYNDAVANLDGRTATQVQGDFDNLFNTLAANLPSSLIFYCSELGWDNTNFTSANVKNKGLVPYAMELQTVGILTGLYCSEMLETVVSATLRANIANWVTVDTHARANPNVTATLTGQFWKAARLGMTSTDGGHFNSAGHKFAAASYLKQLKTVAAFTDYFPDLSTQTVPGWQDPDVMFSFYLTSSGDGYVRSAGVETTGYNSEGINAFYGGGRQISPEEWYLPYKTKFSTYPTLPATIPLSKGADGIFVPRFSNGPPGANTFVSISGGAWIQNGTKTDNDGNWSEISFLGNLGLPAGTYTIRYMCSTEGYGPFTLNATANTRDILTQQGVTVASVNNLTLGNDGNYFQISGTTQINLIANTSWQGGSLIGLYFQGALTVKHNQAVSGVFCPINLAGGTDFVSSLDSVLVLRYDSVAVKWVEVARRMGNTLPFANVAAEPATPPAGTMLFYSKNIAGRMFPKWVGPSGLDEVVQPHIGYTRVCELTPNTGSFFTSIGFSQPIVVGNTITTPAIVATNYKTQARRFTMASAGAAASLASIRATQAECWRGNATGLGGFFFLMRFSLTALLSGNRGFFGLSDVLTAPTNVDPTTSTTPGKVGLAFALNSGNWKLAYNVTGTAPTNIDLGASFPINTTDVIEMVLFGAPNGSVINYVVTNKTSGAVTTANSVSTNIPTSATLLSPVAWMTNNASTPGVSFDIMQWYLETDS